MNKYIRNWGFLAGSDLISQVFGFIIVIRLANVLTPNSYGIYNIVTALAAIFAIVANFGMSQVIIRTIAKCPGATEKLVKNVIPLRMGSIFLMVAIAFLYNYFVHDVTYFILFCTVILSIDATVWDFIESVSFGKKITNYTSLTNILFTIIWAAVVFLIPNDFLSINNVVVIYTIITTMKSLVLLLVSNTKGIFKNLQYDSSYSVNSKDFLKESIPYLWLWGTGVFINQVPLLLLNSHSSSEQVGFYSVGAKLVIPLTMLVATIFRALFPFLSEYYHLDKQRFNNIISLLYTFIVIVGSSIAFFLSLFSWFIVPLLFGKLYTNSVQSFNFLIWSAVIYSVDVMIGNALSAANKQTVLAKLATIDLLIGLPILFYGSYFGSTGLASSRFIYVLITMSYHWVILLKLMKNDVSVQVTFSYKSIATIYSFFIVAFVVSWLPLGIPYKCGVFMLLVAIFSILRNSPLQFLLANAKSLLSSNLKRSN